jgi:predicted component of type VI protein secretion system
VLFVTESIPQRFELSHSSALRCLFRRRKLETSSSAPTAATDALSAARDEAILSQEQDSCEELHSYVGIYYTA